LNEYQQANRQSMEFAKGSAVLRFKNRESAMQHENQQKGKFPFFMLSRRDKRNTALPTPQTTIVKLSPLAGLSQFDTQYDSQKRKSLLTVPECAQTLDDNVLTAYAEKSPNIQELRSREDIVKLLTLRNELGPYDTLHVPCGGADTFYSSITHNAPVEVLTGGEPFGNPAEAAEVISRTPLPRGLTGLGSYKLAGLSSYEFVGFDSGGAYDGIYNWQRSDELGCTKGTLGPLAIYRALAAEDLLRPNGPKIAKIDVASFTIDSNATFHPKPCEKGVNDNLAFWLTRTDGTMKIVLYHTMRFPCQTLADTKKIDALLAFESQVTPKNGMGMLIKGTPLTLHGKPSESGQDVATLRDIQHLMTPPKDLVKSVMTDSRLLMGKPEQSQPVYVEHGGEATRVVDVQFGYGSKLFVYLPKERLPVETREPNVDSRASSSASYELSPSWLRPEAQPEPLPPLRPPSGRNLDSATDQAAGEFSTLRPLRSNPVASSPGLGISPAHRTLRRERRKITQVRSTSTGSVQRS
jgi:hypothetical protein